VELVPADLPVLTNLAALPDAQAWLSSLPALVAAVRDEFDLELSAPLHGGSCSWVAPATLPDGTAVIVKIGWPHREMYSEPAALRQWAGRGAVRLIRHDPARHAMLLSRCVPGLELGRSPAPATERLRQGCAVLSRLWTAPTTHEFERLTDVTAHWATLTEERLDRIRPGYDRGLVAEGVRLLRELPASAGPDVLLHGDFNPGNVLSHGDTWLAIDPKPMVGDAAYDPWPLLQQIDDPFAYAFPATQLRDRVAILAHRLDLAAERIVAWSVARRVETALWAAHHGNLPGGAQAMTEAHSLANL
jgi:streptomycin 6-kinase